MPYVPKEPTRVSRNGSSGETRAARTKQQTFIKASRIIEASHHVTAAPRGGRFTLCKPSHDRKQKIRRRIGNARGKCGGFIDFRIRRPGLRPPLLECGFRLLQVLLYPVPILRKCQQVLGAG